MIAIVLGVVAVLVVIYQLWPASSPVAATASGVPTALAPLGGTPRPTLRKNKGAPGKKVRPPQSLDPMLNLKQLSATEQIKYQGLGRNIFISQNEVDIPKVIGSVRTDDPKKGAAAIYQAPTPPPPPPIPLKFFGFASQAGEPKKIFLAAGEDVFIAGEGEIVDRRYKVVRISPNSVEIQDVVGSGPPQTVPLTQG